MSTSETPAIDETPTVPSTSTTTSSKHSPSDFLSRLIGTDVTVKLNSGVEYRGKLACLDGYMNIALEDTKEYVEKAYTNSYGDAFLRGNNVLYISK
ncbi:U4/U6-U5 snRNP complex subunit lsm6 [Coelomomyces lativittatus]|nr:U4/U6-U5 snRNP complex subunit lsm6 [Coelomomyces lativittatus]KAJ1508637.1 U4/U6-U5 snRNP complex subunit lsm6 [Coelomomyces lativittatus]